MSLFGKKVSEVKQQVSDAIAKADGQDPTIWRTGDQVPGVIERVHITNAWHRESQAHEEWGYVANTLFHFADKTGTERYVQRIVYPTYAPRPGATVTVAYHPEDIQNTIDFDHQHFGRPDPAVPRGWGAGVFTPPAFDRYPPMPANEELNAERELFRTGVPIEAEVVDTKWSGWKQWIDGDMCKQTYRANGVEYQKEFWGARDVTPNRGELIKIVIGSDGTIALDTDEAYTSKKARALVFTTPAAVIEMQDNPMGDAAQLAGIDQMRRKGMITDAQYDVMKAQIGKPVSAIAHAAQIEALEAMHRKGKLTDEQLATAKARLGG